MASPRDSLKKEKCPVCGKLVSVVEHNRGLTQIYTGYEYHDSPERHIEGLKSYCPGGGREYTS